ncbi:MAG TPA: hypothetical protein DD638_11465 [Pasteurellaceae bacterium]|nr:hypothetical protein [Pasteurellaceae bacterium]
MKVNSKSIWFLRVPFAAVFLYHGLGKLAVPIQSGELLELSVPLVLIVGLIEVLAGLGVVLGGVQKIPYAQRITWLSSFATMPILVGAIALKHWGQWSFVSSATHPLGGMEFQVVLLGIAAYLTVNFYDYKKLG